MDKEFEIFKIPDKNNTFSGYLYNHVLNSGSKFILSKLLTQTDVYVFSGVIRDFFIDKANQPSRDLDVVLENDINWIPIYKQYKDILLVSKNSFNGTKVKIFNLNIDIWLMRDTWGLKQNGSAVNPSTLIGTAFFNFSSIVYSIKNKEFYIHKSFIKFLKTNTIDIVFEENPNIPLCIVNAMYYNKKLNMQLSSKLKNWLISNYDAKFDYASTQIKHWHKVIYTDYEIFMFIWKCKSSCI